MKEEIIVFEDEDVECEGPQIPRHRIIYCRDASYEFAGHFESLPAPTRIKCVVEMPQVEEMEEIVLDAFFFRFLKQV